MFMYWAGTAFFLGFLGSAHCLGMCGPLFLALPLGSSWGRSGLWYHLGRILAYTSMGLVLGSLGWGLAYLRWQGILSLILGLALLLGAWGGRSYLVWPWLSGLKRALAAAVAGGAGAFRLGWLNGYLPCGLSYTAVSAAGVQASVWQGGGFMLFFGLGTLPMWLLTMRLGRHQTWRQKLQGTYPWLMTAMGIFLIIRGLGLNIPYLSPSWSGAEVLEHCAN